MKRDIPLNALRAFEAAARLGSFRVAADELVVTPAAVSQLIKSLEAYIGCKLFHRINRGIILTADGSALQSRLGPLLRQLEKTVSLMRFSAGGVSIVERLLAADSDNA